MRFREIFRFELMYQARSVRTWLYSAVLFFAAYLLTANNIEAVRDGRPVLVNSPFAIASATVITSLLWVLMAPAVAGSAAVRDVHIRMHPLVFTAPISKVEYLGGRFVAALVLNALILLAVPAGILLPLLVPGAESEILGPFRPAAYLSTYFVMALPTAVAATALQFSLAALSGRAASSYLGSVFFFVAGFIGAGLVAEVLQMSTLGKLMDPVGYITVLGLLSRAWTPIEKNTIVIGLESFMLANRLLWVGIALGILAFTHRFFRFGHRAATPGSRRRTGDLDHSIRSQEPADTVTARSAPLSVRHVERTFGFATHVRQACAIAWSSFGTIAKSRGGLVLLAIAMFVALFALRLLNMMRVPLIPTTARVVSLLSAPVAENPTPWALVPLLIVFYAGELVWREREARLGEIADAAPVPDWVFFLGKFLGLGLVLALWMALLTTGGVLAQARMGYFDFEIDLYLKVLFGLQLVDYLLFSLLALAVHVVVNQKHVGYLVALIAYGVITFPSRFGIDHDLLAYGSAPEWSYTDLRGFGATLTPWLWFKLYWAAWALLLAVAVKLLWARGTDRTLGARLRLARLRLTPATTHAAAVGAALVLGLGGFIFYNTNVLNASHTASERTERSALYEQRYKRYQGIPQPRLTGVDLHVEIYPQRRAAEIRGTYSLVNRSAVAIDSIHLTTVPEVEAGAVTFDRPASVGDADKAVGYRIYAPNKALQPGESLRLSFEVRHESCGFRSSEVDAFVVPNGTYVTDRDWLPAIGYQRKRELRDAGARRRYGLTPRAALPSLDDAEGRLRERDWVAFEAIVGTGEGQTAVAPGALRRTWTERGRRYFQYATDVPIPIGYSFYSARYALHEARWNPSAGSGQGVAIRIYHHPGHASNLERMVRGIRAALDYYTEQFGPYPFGHLTVVERGSHGDALSAEASTIDYGEASSLLKPGPRDADLVFFGMAHEVSHQWWGHRLTPASVEGEVLMAEGLANYSAMKVLERTYGYEHLQRYLRDVLRRAYQIPRTRAAVPLLRADSAFLGYRKGAHALYGLSRYMGEERMNGALRRLFERHSSGAPLLPTTLDLYRELEAVTPESLGSLLHDLFEANTFWELEIERATAEQTEAGAWQVTLDVRARKVVVDTDGIETEVPMDDRVQIAVEESGKPLYLQMHQIRSGKQTITVTVPRRPTHAGIDPDNLLIDLETDDNITSVKVKN